jgi:hypothetical protein
MVYIYTGLDTIRFFHFTLPIPIFKKKIFPDPIIDQILDQNYDQIPIIDPIKNKRHLPKKKAFFACDKFYSSLWKWTAYQSLLHIFTHFNLTWQVLNKQRTDNCLWQKPTIREITQQ